MEFQEGLSDFDSLSAHDNFGLDGLVQVRNTKHNFDDRTPISSPNPIASSTCLKDGDLWGNNLEDLGNSYLGVRKQGIQSHDSSSSLGLLNSQTLINQNSLVSPNNQISLRNSPPGSFKSAELADPSQDGLSSQEEEANITQSDPRLDQNELDALDDGLDDDLISLNGESFRSENAPLASVGSVGSIEEEKEEGTDDQTGFDSAPSGQSLPKSSRCGSAGSSRDSQFATAPSRALGDDLRSAAGSARSSQGSSRMERFSSFPAEEEKASFLGAKPLDNPFDSSPESPIQSGFQQDFGGFSGEQQDLQGEFESEFVEGGSTALKEFMNKEEAECLEQHRFIPEEKMEEEEQVSDHNTTSWSVPSTNVLPKPAWLADMTLDMNGSKLSASTLFRIGSENLGNLSDTNANRPYWGTTVKSPTPAEDKPGYNRGEVSIIDEIESNASSDDANDTLDETKENSPTSSRRRFVVSTPLKESHSSKKQANLLPGGISSLSIVEKDPDALRALQDTNCSRLSRENYTNTARKTLAADVTEGESALLSLSSIRRCIESAPVGANASALADAILRSRKTLTKLKEEESQRQELSQNSARKSLGKENVSLSSKGSRRGFFVFPEATERNSSVSAFSRKQQSEFGSRKENEQRSRRSSKNSKLSASRSAESVKLIQQSGQRSVSQNDTFKVPDVPMKKKALSPLSVSIGAKNTSVATNLSSVSALSNTSATGASSRPKLEASKQRLCFGFVDLEQTAVQSTTLRNSSREIMRLSVSLRHKMPGFRINDECSAWLLLHPEETFSVKVAFNPTQSVQYTNKILLYVASCAEKFSIPIMGNGGSANLKLDDYDAKQGGAYHLWMSKENVIRDKKILLHNQGVRTGFFKIVAAKGSETASKFLPECGVIKPGRKMKVSVWWKDVISNGKASIFWGEEAQRLRLRSFEQTRASGAMKIGGNTFTETFPEEEYSFINSEELTSVTSCDSRLFVGSLRSMQIRLLPPPTGADATVSRTFAALNPDNSAFPTPSNSQRQHNGSSHRKRTDSPPERGPPSKVMQVSNQKHESKGTLTVNPSSISFGLTKANNWDTVKLEFRNVAKTSNTIRLRVVSGPFCVKCPEYRIDSMKFVRIAIYFEPVEAGVFNGSLEVTSESDSFIVPLKGRAIM